jgi:hypothetical protein
LGLLHLLASNGHGDGRVRSATNAMARSKLARSGAFCSVLYVARLEVECNLASQVFKKDLLVDLSALLSHLSMTEIANGAIAHVIGGSLLDVSLSVCSVLVAAAVVIFKRLARHILSDVEVSCYILIPLAILAFNQFARIEADAFPTASGNNPWFPWYSASQTVLVFSLILILINAGRSFFEYGTPVWFKVSSGLLVSGLIVNICDAFWPSAAFGPLTWWSFRVGCMTGLLLCLAMPFLKPIIDRRSF